MKKIITATLVLTGILFSYSQSEIEDINKVLYDYIEGTANGEPDRLNDAFDTDFNLYFVKNDSLKIWSGRQYISNIKPGKKSNRIGKVLSIDFEGNAAMAKIEILMPGPKRIYTDYLMLLKVMGKWKIIHKSFTFKNYPE
ncbi:nuclear transport factor 2 family protein [Flagellimonas sp. HMM57]|uniref:nuclear transport factor 2 family protein n=1 Tax=unclassified Flagellimonas TaxID=2644544 RepID=UPI0013D82A3C|nr:MULTISPECIES: nuclear transport factor 2 family protein [unclassified Flagellimonas]UII76764.1 nuclear transport factor 2 family protein [Flagellimonas sp. HMM57]